MGRGRQKAKQTKVARELKYFSPELNLSTLQEEFSGSSHGNDVLAVEDSYDDDDYEDLIDKYADWIHVDENEPEEVPA
ncbi:MAG: DUF3073 domain-containing protein [Cellulomonadaceae bacterium]|jgi:hypothetical protein|nr:DUF3073 domain-containing protein [Cellulomonadaceae bacterium]